MQLVEDFTPFLTDFATDATIAASSVKGLFDNGYAEALAPAAGSAPTFLCKVPDLPSITLGTTTISIDGDSYTIVENKPDGFGLTTLVLESL